MNRNIYNYRHVTEMVLPFCNRDQFASDFAVAIEQQPHVVSKLLGNRLNQTITDVIYYRDTARRYKNVPPQKYQRLWNAYCVAYWRPQSLAQATVDEWGYIKWKDIGYEPKLIETAEDAYAFSEIEAYNDTMCIQQDNYHLPPAL